MHVMKSGGSSAFTDLQSAPLAWFDQRKRRKESRKQKNDNSLVINQSNNWCGRLEQ